MTLNCIQLVYDSISKRFLRTLGLQTKYFVRFFFSIKITLIKHKFSIRYQHNKKYFIPNFFFFEYFILRKKINKNFTIILFISKKIKKVKLCFYV